MKLREGDIFRFDAAAAERPVRFIERYLVHYEDRYAGKPFLLLDWQKRLVRDLFGWKRRSGGYRRFRELYLEIAKGAGKSPMLAAIGLYMLVGDGERGAWVISIATDFAQANITFDNGRKFVTASPALARLCVLKQFSIEVPSTCGKWTIMSGTAEGKHGLRPTCVLADEAHEWSNRKLYDNIASNMHKRSQPLMLVATNAGSSRQTICWELHERARKVAEGQSREETLYPVIYAAAKEDDWSAESTWRKANPSLGQTVTVDAYRAEHVKATENPALEARFRRLYLSQWIQGADKWLNLAHWDACVGKLPPAAQRNAMPSYLALDLSQSDDLSALAQLWLGDERVYVKLRHWIPKATAHRYEDRDATPYTQWAADGWIKLLAGETIDPEAQARIARLVAKLAKRGQVKALAYDKWRANQAVAAIEREGIPCVPVPQTTLGLSAACLELERRLKDRSIVLEDSPLLRWQAGNVEVVADNNGNIRPVKEAARGTYRGTRSLKIDGITALLTGLSQVLRHNLQPESAKQWSGEIVCL